MLGWLTSYVFVGRRQITLCRRGMSVFTYHRLGVPPNATRDPYLYVSEARFDEQVGALRRLGLRPVPLGEMVQNASPAGTVAITFDDGFRSTLEHGVGVLARHQVTAIQFLVAGSLGGNNHWDIRKGDVAEPLMDEAAVRDWLAAGQQIGSHSMTHPNLRKITAAAAREEIISSRKRLEDTFGVAVEHFCYPYGSYNPEIRDWVAEAGYRTACTTRHGVNLAGGSPMELRRFIPLSGRELVRKVFHRLRKRFSEG